MKKLLLILLFLSTSPVTAATLTEFFWDTPTLNSDGAPVTDLAGYVLYCGDSPGNYTHVHDIAFSSPTSITFVAALIPDGIQFCAMTAYNENGDEGEFTDVVGPLNFIGGTVNTTVTPVLTGFGVR